MTSSSSPSSSSSSSSLSFSSLTTSTSLPSTSTSPDHLLPVSGTSASITIADSRERERDLKTTIEVDQQRQNNPETQNVSGVSLSEQQQEQEQPTAFARYRAAQEHESHITQHARDEATHAAVPECIVPDYVYSPNDPIELVPPYPNCYTEAQARYQDEQERITCEALGIPYHPKPQLATSTVITPEQRDALISEWNRDGYGFSLAPSSYPVRGCWRTRPCLGFAMLQDPMCDRVQRAGREMMLQQIQSEVTYKQQRDTYLIHLFNTQGLQALEDALQEEQSMIYEQAFKIKVQEYAQQHQHRKTETGTTTAGTTTGNHH